MPSVPPCPGGHGVRVLYIVYWGLLEPLGRSLVLPAMIGLAERGAEITVLSYEKPGRTLADEVTLRRTLNASGVAWKPQRYHKRPRVPATALDIVVGWLLGTLACLRMRCDVVHARTFVGGLIGVVVARLTRSAFVYHNEGFYPDEQVDSGVWRAGSLPHRLARALERYLYRAADGIIVLSKRASALVGESPGVNPNRKPIVVVPSCVDLDRFVPRPPSREPPTGGIRFVYAGSVGGRYRLGDVGQYVAAALAVFPGTRLTILSWASSQEVGPVLERAGLPECAWSLRAVAHHDMAEALGGHQVGLHFANSAAAGAGGSPTKVGEYWACGLPALVTPGMGDLDAIISSERVGAVVSDRTPAGLRQSVIELEALLRDPGLASRCRAAAKAHYDLSAGCETQIGLYHRLGARAS
jgi:glycosyltransferase involved in cell wall biosynthesis